MSDPTRPAPPTVYRWVVLVLISVAMFGNYYVYDTIAPIADLLKSNLSYTDEQIGLLYTVYSIAAIIVLLAGGVLIDLLGTKKATFIFAVITTIAGVVTALSPNFGVMATGRFILGMGAEPLIVAITVALAKWFKGKELSFAFAINLLIARLGSVAADNSPTWAGSLYDGWQGPLWLGAGIGIVCVLGAGVYWMLESNAERRYTLGSAGTTDRLVFKDLVSFSPSYWLVVGLCLTFYSAIFPFRSFAIKFFMEGHDMTREAAGFLNSILPMSAMVATPLFGLLADRIGKRALLMAIASTILLPVYLMLAYSSLPPIVAVVMMGIAFSLIPAVMWPSVAYIVEERRLGTAYALMTLLQQIGLAGMNWGIGKVNDLSHASATNPGGYAAGMWIFSILGVVGLGFSWLLRRAETGPGAHGLETITVKSAS